MTITTDALGRRPSRGPGQGGGSIWQPTPEQQQAAANVCARYARDGDELAVFLGMLGIEGP